MLDRKRSWKEEMLLEVDKVKKGIQEV